MEGSSDPKKLMRVVCYEKCGGGVSGLKHLQVPIPTPKRDEILIKVDLSSLNPADWKVQKGDFYPFLPQKFPFVPGTDVTGEVVDIGPGVENLKLGDKVVSLLDFWNGGGLAEYAIGLARLTVKLPQDVSMVETVGLPTSGLTALQALNKAGIKFDAINLPVNILITAASGGIGHYAVQLAKLTGVHVTATCGARNTDFVKSLGADEVLDYQTPEGGLLRSPSGRKYDAIINCTTGLDWSTLKSNLSPRGTVVDLNSHSKAFLHSLRHRFSRKTLVSFMMKPEREDLELLVKMVRESKIKTHVDSTFPLSNAEEAWDKSMHGHATEKILIVQ